MAWALLNPYRSKGSKALNTASMTCGATPRSAAWVDELLLHRPQDGRLLLADRVAQRVRLGTREAAQGDGRGHDVLLVDEDPVRPVQEGLQQRVEVARPAPGRACAGCRPGCCPSGPGGRAPPWPRGRRPMWAAARGCSGACPRTRAGTRRSSRPTPAARTSWRRRAGCCRGRPLTPRCSLIRSTALRRIVRLDRPRKSNLSRPSASMPCISYWVMSASELVAFWSGISSVSGSREMTTPAAWVDALRATPSSCWANPISLPICGSPSCISLSCGRQLQRLGELDAQLVGHGLRDPVHVAVAHAHDPADVADGRAGEHRAEGDDLGDVVLAVLAADVVDDLVPALVLEVHVDIGHRHAVRVEEPLERQPVVERVHRRDAQRVGDDGTGRGPSAGGGDPLLAGEAGRSRPRSGSSPRSPSR